MQSITRLAFRVKLARPLRISGPYCPFAAQEYDFIGMFLLLKFLGPWESWAAFLSTRGASQLAPRTIRLPQRISGQCLEVKRFLALFGLAVPFLVLPHTVCGWP
jgi:hypothetical protein